MGIVITAQCINIGVVILRDDHVHQASPLFADSFYQQGVSRSHYNEGYQSDMLRQTFILLLVAFEVFLLSTLHANGDEQRRGFRTPIHIAIPFVFVLSFYDAKRFTMTNHLRIDGIGS